MLYVLVMITLQLGLMKQYEQWEILMKTFMSEVVMQLMKAKRK